MAVADVNPFALPQEQPIHETEARLYVIVAPNPFVVLPTITTGTAPEPSTSPVVREARQCRTASRMSPTRRSSPASFGGIPMNWGLRRVTRALPSPMWISETARCAHGRGSRMDSGIATVEGGRINAG